ncbi:MAG: hypothetical protein NUV51_04380 [Sulfuricaulis sp.]|nr:hypothetical protein [Sulfuricaulis sp.]
MIRLDVVNRRPGKPVRVLLNGREIGEVVALAALWNGGPGYVETLTRVGGVMVVDDMRQAVCSQPRFGLVRVEPIE